MKKKSVKKNSEEKNPNFNISNFENKHIFFFDITKYIGLLFKIFDMNELKLDEEQIELLLTDIKNCKTQDKELLNPIQIKILPLFFDTLNNIQYPDLKKTQYAINISNIMMKIKKNNGLPTLKKISKEYEEKYNKSISISTVSRVLKKNLEMRYLKTVIKNPKLNEYNYIFMTLIFIKGIIRSKEIGLNIVYVDETGFMLENNNFYTWRERNNEFYGGSKSKLKEKLNLILGVNKNKVIAKLITKENIDQKYFIKFISEIASNLGSKESKNSIIIMDNAAYHKTSDVITIFKKNKFKVLTIPPYKSSFNMVELVFRFIKNITYKNIFYSVEEMKNEVEKILDGEDINKSLLNMYRETLEKYMDFTEKYKNIDYNDIYDKIISGNENDEINLNEDQ